jgi:hypothetical protein
LREPARRLGIHESKRCAADVVAHAAAVLLRPDHRFGGQGPMCRRSQPLREGDNPKGGRHQDRLGENRSR